MLKHLGLHSSIKYRYPKYFYIVTYYTLLYLKRFSKQLLNY